MKKALKILSVLCVLVLIIGTVSVGMSAYAASDDILGDSNFTISNVYKDINWDNVNTYKGATHVHTVRSDGDEEINRMIRKYYELGFDAMALTDHGTINYGWANDQSRLAFFEWQYFVHGATDELGEDEYKQIITGTKDNRGYGMMEIPLGIELNGASTIKCHINGYYADADHGGIGLNEDWPLNAVVKNYNAGGFTHINHVGEWTDGNDDPTVYSASWISRFCDIYKNYCPNRGGRSTNDITTDQTGWMAAHKGEAGVIGMELVNTSDNRTKNDRRYVYDEILKVLAPQGINVFGFCEDDSHEYSDCDKNAQFFLINKTKDVKITEALYNSSNKADGNEKSAYKNNNADPMDKVQNYYRDAMFYGEFYASSKNSKNSYELGDGFSAVGPYPSISNISVDNDKDQISVTYRDATKVRLVADGTIIETYKSNAGVNTVVFDLNKYESQINSYVRIYLTGAGGITYLQPFLVKKEQANQSTVQFVDYRRDEVTNEYRSLTSDVVVNVEYSNGSAVEDSLQYANFVYTLLPGEYTYTASRRGYQTKTETFTVTQDDIDNGRKIKVPIELEEVHDVSYAYFYTPETIYLSPDNNRNFDKYIDRDNEIAGNIHTEAQSRGNIYFYREGATNIELSFEFMDSPVLYDSITINQTTASSDELSTYVSGGVLARPLTDKEHVLIQWKVTYDFKGRQYEAYSYSYVYRSQMGTSDVLSAGGYAKTKHQDELFAGWKHSTMYILASIFVSGINKLEYNNTRGASHYGGYKYGPHSGIPFASDEKALVSGGIGYYYVSDESAGGSVDVQVKNDDIGYIYADRSRVNNWSQIPYLHIGLDINKVVETTGEDGSNAAARLLFDTTLTVAKDGTYDSDDVLYNLSFSDRSSYTEKKDYNLTDNSFAVSTSGSASNSMESIGSKRLYMSDNDDSSTTIVKPLPDSSADQVTVPISAYVKGTKASRADEVSLEVDLCVKNVDKSSLRTEFNDTVKLGLQRDWFQTNTDWEEYEGAVARAGERLGNPATEQADILESVQELQTIVDKFELRQGMQYVEHHSRYNGVDSLIYRDNPVSYSYGDDLAANAAIITGYEYANEYDLYFGSKLVYRCTNGIKQYYNDNGTPETGHTEEAAGVDFDLAFAENDSYKWVFYYNPHTYTATYDLKDPNAEPITYNAVPAFAQDYVICPDIPQRPGYTFSGWYFDLADKTYNAGSTIKWNYSCDGEFSAQWISEEYDVSYDFNGGNESYIQDSYKKVHYGDTYSVFDVLPTRTGYNFLGWALNGETDSDNFYGPGSNVTWEEEIDSVFTAQWIRSEYNISFDLSLEDDVIDEEGLTVPESIVRGFDDPYGELPTVERAGYTLEWYSDPACQNNAKVTASTPVKIAGDHALYAKWIPIDYDINYNLSGGSFATPNPASYNIESGNIVLNPPEKTGFDFVGWIETNYMTSTQDEVTINCAENTITDGDNNTYNFRGELNFTAVWVESGYTITYNLDGGINHPNNPETYKAQDSFTILEPTKKGYRFLGWTGSNGNVEQQQVVIPQGTTGEKEYNANWLPETYRISYDYDGGTVATANPEEYTVDTNTFTLVVPDKSGYVFDGWLSNDDSLSGMSVQITKGQVTGNLTFKALWKLAGENSIRYTLNGGVVEGNNPTKYRAPYSCTIESPTRPGYDFDGWTKKVNGVADSGLYNPGTITESDNGEIEFIANWSALEYDITYNLVNGNFVTNKQNPAKYTPETEDITLVNPIKPGYVFDGWTGTGLTAVTKTVVIPTGSFGDRVYTAAWRTVDYKIDYVFNGGADAGLIKTYNATTNDQVGAPIRPGFSFEGWNICFEEFNWTSGSVDSNGKFITQTGSYYSDPVSLQSGITYSIDSSVTGLKLCVYENNASEWITTSTTGSYTPESDCIAFIIADNKQLADIALVKLKLSGIHSSYLIKSGSAGDMEFTANWEEESYTITYLDEDNTTNLSFGVNSDGTPKPNPNPASYTYNSDDITLVNPVKTGYTFSGWEYNGAILTNAIIKKNSTGNRTYRATWTLAVYTITYEEIDGATDTGNPTTYTFEDRVELNNPSKTGFVFDGWMENGHSPASKQVVIEAGSTGDRTYTAKWTAVRYSITYNLNGAADVQENPNYYTINTNTFTLVNPRRTGATFEGWTGSNGFVEQLQVVIPKGTTGDKTYTANWELTTYHIYYVLGGGEVDPETPNPETYNVETSTIELNNPVRAGYNFKGWTGAGLAAPTLTVYIEKGSTTGNKTYTANWEPINYRITYNLDGGRVAANANPATYNIESSTIKLVNPVKAGYAFEGWTGTDYTTPSTEVVIPKGSTGNRTYTATWREDGYEIKYYGIDGATFEAENRVFYTVATDDFIINNPSKAGYTFTGWTGTGISGGGMSTEVIVPKGSTGNRNYTANWELDTYTIYYELNGGSEGLANPREYTYISAPITLYNPVRTGFAFVGWMCDDFEEPQRTVIIPTNSIGDRAYEAIWDTGNYTITLDLEGGSLSSGQTEYTYVASSGKYEKAYTYESNAITLPTPERAGFTFAGWTGTEISGSVPSVTIASGSIGNRDYTAKWVSGNNVLTYDLVGGSFGVDANGTPKPDPNPSSYVTNSGTLTIISPQKEGYKFNGWTSDNNSIVTTTFTKAAVIDTTNGGSVNFTANWTKIKYKITYNLNGGTLPDSRTNAGEYYITDKITLVNPVREGYDFKGWSGTDLDSSFKHPNVSFENETGNRTYTANWGEKNYTISYTYNGGSTDTPNPMSYNVLTPSFTLNNPEKTGYTFTGWTGSNITTDQPDPQTVVTVSSGSTGNKEFIANFDIITYKIFYEGINGVDAQIVASLPQTYTVSSDVSIPNPTKTGYDFLGWESTDSLDPERDVVISKTTGDKVYTAKWSPIQYTITYELDGGVGYKNNPTKYTIESSKIVIVNPTKSGFGFKGWRENGSERYTPTATIGKGSSGNKTFTAVWGPENYTIDYHGLESLSDDSIAALHLVREYTMEDEVVIPNPARPGYTFQGWTGSNLPGATKNVVIPVNSTGNKSYNATWTIDTYLLSVNLDGGEVSKEIPETYTYESETIVLPTPIKPGYTFLGWRETDDVDGPTTKRVEILNHSVGNKAYTAVWSENTGDTHRFYFYGYMDKRPLILDPETGRNYVEVNVGEKITPEMEPAIFNPETINETAGYVITGWNIDFNSDSYVYLHDDVKVYGTYEVGPDTFEVTVNSEDGAKPVTADCGMFEKYTARASSQYGGQPFSHWVAVEYENEVEVSREVVSYYMNYTFFVHSDVVLFAVYGTQSGMRAKTRVSLVEDYDPNYDWFTVYVERNVATELTLVQHGLIFTVNSTIGQNENLFKIGASSDVYNAVSSLGSLTGLWTVSIWNPYKYGEVGTKFYLRSYVKVADENGTIETIYSDNIKEYVNTKDNK